MPDLLIEREQRPQYIIEILQDLKRVRKLNHCHKRQRARGIHERLKRMNVKITA